MWVTYEQVKARMSISHNLWAQRTCMWGNIMFDQQEVFKVTTSGHACGYSIVQALRAVKGVVTTSGPREHACGSYLFFSLISRA